MSQNFLAFGYDDRRIYIFDIPSDKETLEALRIEYNLDKCHLFNEKHLVCICETKEIRQVLIAAGKIKLNGKEYKVYGFTKRDGQPLSRFEYYKFKNVQETRIQQQIKAKSEVESKKRTGCGRGSMVNLQIYDRLSNDLEDLDIKDNVDLNNNREKIAIATNDYVKRVERLLPGYFSNKDMAHVVDEKEKKLLAGSLVNEFPELFRDYTEDELKICPYPDMSLQDEVMRMTDELLTRKCERARPKKKFALRMKFTDEEEELLVCIKFISSTMINF